MAKKKKRKNKVEATREVEDLEPVEQRKSIFSHFEDSLYRTFRKDRNEAKAGLGNTEWFVYLGLLLVVLVTPFLYSRQTTENFLTPKEFFSKIALVLLGGIYCIRVFITGRVRFSSSSLDFPIALFFGFCALSVLWNYNASSAIRDLRGTFAILLLYPLIVNIVRSRWQVELILWVVVIAGLLTSTLGIMETYNLYFKFDAQNLITFVKDDVIAGNVDPKGFYLPLFPQLANNTYSMGSIVSTFGNRNYLGTFAMFTAFIPLAFFFYYRTRFMKLLSLGLYGWMLFALYITRCRAALIGIVFGFIYMIVMLLLNDRNKKLMKRNAIFFGAAVVLIFAMLFWVSVTTLTQLKTTSMWDKIKGTLTLDRAASNTYERMWVWYATIQSFRLSIPKWLVGSGLGSFKHFFPYQEAETYSDANQETFTAVTFRQAHNDWLQVLAELGLIGLILFFFLVYRFFNSIYRAIHREVWKPVEGEMNGDHILLIGIGAAMIAQLMAAIPDFPFHRIETALYAVVFLALVPVLTETDFFQSPLKRKKARVMPGVVYAFVFLALSASLLSAYHDLRSWQADEKVRQADMYMKYRRPDAHAKAKSLLIDAIELDPLPGDPYLKMSLIYENEKEADIALRYADKAFKNINYNARSTYHSIVFRKLHIYYHLTKDLVKAYEMAEMGLSLTCGKARSIYYMYGGKIALDITKYQIPADRKQEMMEKAEIYLEKAADYKAFSLQAKASLAVIKATLQKWEDALEVASEVSANVKDRDPTMLNIIGISSSNLGLHEKAEQALKKAVMLKPDNNVFLRDLGVVSVRLKKFPQARRYLEKVALSPASPPQMKQHAKSLVASITSAEVAKSRSLLQQQELKAARPLLTSLARGRLVGTETKKWANDNLAILENLPAEKNVHDGPAAEMPDLKLNDSLEFRK
jgi:tetratricopeptide (TPR) repeat protein